MLCYKEVHCYNGRYYSRFDNGYEFKIGEYAIPSGDNYIYATDTLDNALKYAYVPYDMAVLEMEIDDNFPFHKNGYIITAKKVKVLREVTKDERYNTGRSTVYRNDDNAKLYSLLQQRKESILRGM